MNHRKEALRLIKQLDTLNEHAGETVHPQVAEMLYRTTQNILQLAQIHALLALSASKDKA